MPNTPNQIEHPSRSSRMVTNSPVFFGWIVMLAGSFGMIMTSPGQTYGVSIFIEHFITDLGISRSMVSTYYAIGTLMGAAALPFVGRRIDAVGPRIMVVIIAILFGLACIFLGTVVSNSFTLLIGFVLIRMLGQGSLGLVSTYTINQWWMRRRGMVMGISGVLVSLLGVGLFPNLLNWMIPQLGWRTTTVVLGLALIFIMAPIGYLFYRSQPENYGLLPDGVVAAEPQPSVAQHPKTDEQDWTLAEAIRTPSFWIVVAGLSTFSMLATGLTFHMISIFDDNQLSATAAAAVYVPIAMVSAAVTLGSGILVDRIPIRFLLAGAMFIQAGTLLLAQSLSSATMALAYGVALGFLFGMMGTVSRVAWPTYYGRRYLGSITGLTTTFIVAGSALGPLPLGYARDTLGSYNLALTVLAVIPLVLGIVTLFMRQPVKTAANEFL